MPQISVPHLIKPIHAFLITLIETQDPYISWSLYREDCGKDIEKFIEMCKDEIESCKKEMYKTSMIPAEKFNK